jgi:hypothetical protein
MAGSYINGEEDAVAPLMSRGCLGSPGGYINDLIGKGCWGVTGAPIIIGDTSMSVQYGFEMCNFNFRVFTTFPAVANQTDLSGPIV